MIFDGLVVLQRCKSQTLLQSSPLLGSQSFSVAEQPLLPPGSYELQSCQRSLWAFVSMDGFSSLYYRSEEGRQRLLDLGLEVHHGVDAYAYLLQVATGLQSQMRGETEVLGQIKQSWKVCEKSMSPQAKALGPVFQKLFEDSKEIRSQHLRNVGSCSYGSLLRKILTTSSHHSSATPSGHLLLVGAGQFAQSLVPWFSQFQVSITNRSRPKAAQLALLAQQSMEVIDWNLNDAQSWAAADHLILCVPGGDAQLEKQVLAWKASHPHGVVFDLGEPAVCGSGLIPTVSLQDLFALQKQELSTADAEIEKAKQACVELALKRENNATLTLPFGWDDLWVYG